MLSVISIACKCLSVKTDLYQDLTYFMVEALFSQQYWEIVSKTDSNLLGFFLCIGSIACRYTAGQLPPSGFQEEVR